MSGDLGASLRTDVEDEGITVLPGVYDALSALMAERAGFDAVFTSGFSISVSKLGYPDMGFMERAENLDTVSRIVDSIDIPLVADMDTGYGNVLNVRRTIHECMETGVAGVILEDQEWPKKCGHMEEKRVIEPDEHARRIRAACDVRDDHVNDLVVIARTDAREPLGLDDAIERGHLYLDAGADVIFIEAPMSMDELREISDEFSAPTFANMIEGGKTPYLRYGDLEDIGFDVVVYPLAGLFGAASLFRDLYSELHDEGHVEETSLLEFDEFDDVIGSDGYREIVHRYAEMYK